MRHQRSLPPSSSASSALDKTRLSHSGGFSIRGLAWVFVICLVFGLVYLIRNDEQVNRAAALKLLTQEHKGLFAAELLKKLMNVNIELSSLELRSRAAQGDAQTVELLLHAGVDPDAIDSQGKTALHVAVESGQAQVLSTLLAAKLNVDARDASGRSPLHYAAAAGDELAALYLLNLGAEVDAIDARGFTPLQAAVSGGKPGTAALLLQRGANLEHVSASGATAVSLARESSDPKTKELIETAARPLQKVETKPVDLAPQVVNAEPTAPTPAVVTATSPTEAPAQTPPAETPAAVATESRLPPEEPLNPPAPPPAAEVKSRAPIPVPEPLTRLRVLGEPQGVWERSDKLTLKSVKVEVRNAGTVAAKGIKVLVTIPGGRNMELKGPTELEKNKSAVYTASDEQNISRNGVLKAKVSCSNCWH